MVVDCSDLAQGPASASSKHGTAWLHKVSKNLEATKKF